MRSRVILQLLLLAILLSTMACSYQAKNSLPESNTNLASNAEGEGESDGIGGTGLKPEGDGLGGTGTLAEGDGLGGTGIIGPISGFGSIIVNGMHIEYSPKTPIKLNGEHASTEELKIGRVVEVHARSAGGELTAQTIAVMDAVVGPIEAINREDGTLRVLGQTVYLDKETVLTSRLDMQKTLKNLKRGDLMRVSGLHLANGALVATRMEPAGPNANWLVTGLVRGLTANGLSIGGLRIKRDAVWPDGLRNGRLALVRGEQVDGHFLGQNLLLKPDTPFNGMAERLVIQGYPSVAMRPDLLRIGNLRMDMPAGSAVKEISLQMPLIQQRIQLTAYIGRNGIARAEQMAAIRPVPAAAISRLLPDLKLPSIPHRDFQWNRTPDQHVPQSPVFARPIKLQQPSIDFPRLRTPSGTIDPVPEPPVIITVPNQNLPVGDRRLPLTR